eukprot:TRINITY_DN579_c0_g1_i1.p1 TRINITY_DN579_c0_g1~~TRINITY_DN579_c0_g1_i1.p1  ORF type:complete len:516 (+),score=112.25 TRINITY_DN579_c0_g1_i1:313-1860(+)
MEGWISHVVEGSTLWTTSFAQFKDACLVITRGKRQHFIPAHDMTEVEACNVRHMKPPETNSHGARVCIKDKQVFFSVSSLQLCEALIRFVLYAKPLEEGAERPKLACDERGFPKCLLSPNTGKVSNNRRTVCSIDHVSSPTFMPLNKTHNEVYYPPYIRPPSLVTSRSRSRSKSRSKSRHKEQVGLEEPRSRSPSIKPVYYNVAFRYHIEAGVTAAALCLVVFVSGAMENSPFDTSADKRKAWLRGLGLDKLDETFHGEKDDDEPSEPVREAWKELAAKQEYPSPKVHTTLDMKLNLGLDLMVHDAEPVAEQLEEDEHSKTVSASDTCDKSSKLSLHSGGSQEVEPREIETTHESIEYEDHEEVGKNEEEPQIEEDDDTAQGSLAETADDDESRAKEDEADSKNREKVEKNESERTTRNEDEEVDGDSYDDSAEDKHDEEDVQLSSDTHDEDFNEVSSVNDDEAISSQSSKDDYVCAVVVPSQEDCEPPKHSPSSPKPTLALHVETSYSTETLDT